MFPLLHVTGTSSRNYQCYKNGMLRNFIYVYCYFVYSIQTFRTSIFQLVQNKICIMSSNKISGEYAAGGGHLDVLKWLRLPDEPEGKCDWDGKTCLKYASGPNALSIRAWISSQADSLGE